jgi:hypothetical protein
MITETLRLEQFSTQHPFHYDAAPLVDNTTPLLSLIPVPLCAICSGLRQYERSLTHHTPDCIQYICMVCEVSQPGHFPADCPQRSPSVYHDAHD